MNDHISRRAAVEAIERTDWYHINQNGELVSGANSQEHEPLYRASDIYAALEEAPSADVVEVVRCKDCKYGSPNGVYGCRLERYNFNDESVRMYGEDYCSYGERITYA